MEREPHPDDPWDNDEYVRRLVHAEISGNIVHNGSSKFANWMLSVIAGIMIVGVVGGVVLYGQVQRIDAKVDLIIQGRIK